MTRAKGKIFSYGEHIKAAKYQHARYIDSLNQFSEWLIGDSIGAKKMQLWQILNAFVQEKKITSR